MQPGAVIHTDVSLVYSPSLNWSLSVRLVDFIPILHAEFLAVVLALRKMNASIVFPVIISGSLSDCLALTAPKDTPIQRPFK